MTEIDPASSAGTQTLAPSSGLVVENLSKTFVGTKALDDVTAHFPAGEITALLGENGSGKSTLIKILAGFYHPDDGPMIRVAGRELPTPIAPKKSHEAGLRFIHQDLGLVEELTVQDNFSFVNGFGTPVIGLIRMGSLRRRVLAALDEFGVEVDPDQVVSTLTPTERTMVAIAAEADVFIRCDSSWSPSAARGLRAGRWDGRRRLRTGR